MSANNSKPTRYQKEAIGLLSIGTFLEYFDLMLYVHMAVLLNDLFFPKTDPLTAKLLGAFALSVTFFFRPVGAIVIGKIGDYIGRKNTIIITTFIMGLSCFIMANMRTYAEIGITASIGVIMCRILQSFSSLGEIVGAQLYVSEILKRPNKFMASGIIEVSASIGGLVALLIALFSTYFALNWRLAFWFGLVVCVVGLVARTRLRETPEFADYKTRMKIKNQISDCKYEDKEPLQKEKIDKKLALAYFVFSSMIPLCFYITYIYMGDLMKKYLEMSFDTIVMQNLKITILSILGTIVSILLMKKTHPIKILRSSLLIFLIFLPFIPYTLNNLLNVYTLTLIQVVMFLPAIAVFGMEICCFVYIPINKRFSYFALLFGLSGALSFTLFSFFLVYIENYVGFYSIWVIYAVMIYGAFSSIKYLKKLEIKTGRYYNYPNEDLPHEDTAIKEEDYEYENLEDEYEPYKSKCEYSEALLSRLEIISKEQNRKLNMKLIEKAVIFAKKWHGTKMRKTGDHPSYFHPLAVAVMVAEYYCKTDVIVAAILHDVVEDSDCDIELIKNEFNTRIAQIVDRLTKKRIEDGKKVILSFEQTIKKLQALNDYEALFIKKIDRKHNLETIEGLSPEKQKKMAEETNNIFMRLIGIIGDKLGIHGKLRLENNIFQLCYRILRRK
ncbi:MAG: MFS transporter [Rickettsiales bacterium]|nr:MFS transporter [Rickettsiales bacterium]